MFKAIKIPRVVRLLIGGEEEAFDCPHEVITYF